METSVERDQPRFYAGTWCLDFANTVEPRTGSIRHDFVPDYPALLQWARTAGIVGHPAYRRLVRAGAADQPAAAAAHERALALREATYRLFAAVADARRPPVRELELIHRAWVDGLDRCHPRITDTGLSWAWRTEFDLPRWRLAADAIELLRSDALARVKRCQPACSWLFLDTTKNRSRRWCSMRECGFGEKARLQAIRRANR